MKYTLERWWHRPDHFDWLTAYIADHGLQPITRWVIGTSAALLALTAGLMPVSLAGPHGVAADTVSVLASVLGVALAGIWLIGWPTRAKIQRAGPAQIQDRRRWSTAAISGCRRPALSKVPPEFVPQRLRRTSHRGIVSQSSP